MRRIVSIVLSAVLVIGVIITIVATRGSSTKSLLSVTGVIGSEKKPFFDDPEVQAIFHKAGYDVHVDTAGSRQIASQVDLSKYDFAFPAGTPQADKIKRDRKAKQVYVPFSTPMAIATFSDIAGLLQKAGVATDRGGWWSFDMGKYLALVKADTRWKSLPGNTTYPVNKQLLITSTDINTSNSAAMYASITSYVLNGSSVIATASDVAQVAPDVAALFARQGYTEQSSEAPFDDYLSIGMGKTPMVMIYEAQFVARAAKKDGSVTPSMVLMYPEPTVVSKHTLVPLTTNGDAIGALLTTNADLQRLAVKYGFRTSQPAAFDAFVTAAGVKVAPQLLDVIEPPNYDNLEALIQATTAAMKQSNNESPTSTPETSSP